MKITQLLDPKNPETELLLEYALKEPKEFLYLSPNYELTGYELKRFRSALAKRKQGVPVAYILGYKYFQGFKFKVNKNVLIPRPETETLVDLALTMVKDKRLRINNVLDLGTGSGCIAISLCKLAEKNGLKLPKITASDISGKALYVARYNANKLQANISFVQSNLFQNLKGKYDLILANLPYVPKGLFSILEPTLKYEPKLAITDNTDTWEIFGEFFKNFEKHLSARGAVLMEIDDDSKTELRELFKQNVKNYKSFKLTFLKDLGNRTRFLNISRG